MATVRYLVVDVDASLPFYSALGFTMTKRWGPPFAVLARDGLTLWLSGPETSASRPLASRLASDRKSQACIAPDAMGRASG